MGIGESSRKAESRPFAPLNFSFLECLRETHMENNKIQEEILKRIRIYIIRRYLDIVKEIKVKKRLKSEEKRNYVINILRTLILYNRLFLDRKTYQFSYTDYIDLENEIDCERLKFDNSKYIYSPDRESEITGHRLLNTNNEAFSLCERFYKNLTDKYKEHKLREYLNKQGVEYKIIQNPSGENEIWISKSFLKVLDNFEVAFFANDKQFSLSEIYNLWLPTLNSELMQSKDFLDQLLVCYTIKNANNGDQEAINKLFSLYEDTAIGIAVNMMIRRRLPKHIIENNEIISNVKLLLRLIIAGIRPNQILEMLKNQDTQLPLKSFVNFYFWFYTEYFPKYLERPASDWYTWDIVVMLDPYALIDSDIKKSMNLKSRRFNYFVYIPNKKSNFTTWLFGTRRNPMQGKLPQLLNDYFFKAYSKRYKEWSDDFMDIEDTENNEKSAFKKEVLETASRQELRPHREKDEVVQELVKKGISKRNAEIFYDNKFFKKPQIALSKEYSLSRMQIHRICAKVTQVIIESDI